MNKLRLIVVLVIVLVLALVGLSLTNRHKAAKAQTQAVTIHVNIADTTGLATKLDGHDTQMDSTDTVLHLKAGHHSLELDKLGYYQFTTDFTVVQGQPVTINAIMRRSVDSTINSASQIEGLAEAAPNSKLTNIVYFYDKTWAVVTVNSNGNSGTLVVYFDDSAQNWKIILGPGTLFSNTSMGGLPNDVVTYMQNNNLIAPGSEQ
jgi:hypothetical protein